MEPIVGRSFAVSEYRVLPPIESWHAIQLRLTAFIIDSTTLKGRDLWRDFFDEAPESKTERGMVTTYEGRHEGHQLTLVGQPVAIQWALDPTPQAEIETIGPATLGALPGAVDSFSLLMQRWLPMCPEIKRLAFGAILSQPADDRRAAYQTLGAYLPAVTLDPESQDFQYMINRRRISRTGIEGLQINRLSQWCSMHRQQIQLQIAVAETTPVMRAATSDMGVASCQLSLDINTVPENTKALDADRIVEVWRELVDLGKEIAANGDIP